MERRNRTLVSMLRVYCSRYTTDWDRYLPEVMGAYNSTQHSTTGVSPHMMLTGHEKSLPLTFFYPEYEGKKTLPQVYARDVIRRHQESNDLCSFRTEVVGLEEITVSQEIDIVDDHDDEWVDDRSKPEVKFDDEQQQSYEQDLTNLRVLEWLNEMTSDPKETSVTIQDVDRESMNYMKTEREDPSLAAQEGRLLIPASNLQLLSREWG